MRYDDFTDPHYSGYCLDCEQFVTTETEDCSYGSLDIRGRKITHKEYRECCPLCGGIVEEGPEREDEDA